MSDLADQYFHEIVQEADIEHDELTRVSMTVRFSPKTKSLIERIASKTGKSLNTVASDILYYGSIETAVGLAQHLNMSQDEYKCFVYGDESC